jgi:lipoyl(octanoyl) transferase
MAPEWQLWIDHSARPGWANMSIDLTLLDRAEHEGEHWLRLYRWDPACLSFGRHEPALRRYDAGRIAALGVQTVRRPTGGRAVWHERELTYAVAGPCSVLGSLREAYTRIHELLVEALRALGISATLAPQATTPPLNAGACFARPVGGEVLVDGRKVVGSAQLRGATALLQHGSILLHDDQHRVTALQRGTNPAGSTTSCSADPLGGLSTGDLANAVAGSARLYWGGAGAAASDPDQVVREARSYHDRFRSDAWTWARLLH